MAKGNKKIHKKIRTLVEFNPDIRDEAHKTRITYTELNRELPLKGAAEGNPDKSSELFYNNIKKFLKRDFVKERLTLAGIDPKKLEDINERLKELDETEHLRNIATALVYLIRGSKEVIPILKEYEKAHGNIIAATSIKRSTELIFLPEEEIEKLRELQESAEHGEQLREVIDEIMEDVKKIRKRAEKK